MPAQGLSLTYSTTGKKSPHFTGFYFLQGSGAMPLHITEKHIPEISGKGSCGETTGYFYKSDSAKALPCLQKDWKGKFQMIYLDPPFFTKQNFSFDQKIGREGWSGNRKYQISLPAYSDQWESRESFLDMLRQVLNCSYELLKPEGSIFLHLDYRFDSYARILMDEIFGEENMLNEIIWAYHSGGRARKHFSRKHDTILFYRKSDLHYFDMEAVGRPRGTEKRNNMKRETGEDGRVFWSVHSNGKEYRYYEDSLVYPSDVWGDISHLQQRDPERTGYATQKPEALLERMIRSTTRPGDWVGDFFAGSGTTLAVAQKNGRRWVGMDSSDFSLIVSRKRLLQAARQSGGCISISDPEMKPVEQGESGAEVQMSCQGDKRISLQLMNYPCRRLAGSSDFLDCIDYWSAGIFRDGTFISGQYSFRTSKNPDLSPTLVLPGAGEEKGTDLKGGRIAVHVIDIYGKQSLILLRDTIPENFAGNRFLR